MKTKNSFQRVILYARHHRANQDVNETLERLVHYLQAKALDIFIDSDTADSFHLPIGILARQSMGKKNDLIIVVGGDGSLLAATRIAIKANIPVIGINRGRLGFLTDISPQQFEAQLDAVLAGDYIEEKRFLLQARICEGEHTLIQADALNDVVLSGGSDPHLIEFDVYVNQQFVSHYRSDGLIVATPTGSTAYALSAGGPIMHPQLNAMVLVPMFSHSLSSRPLVIDGESCVDIKISKQHENDLQISCDGHESLAIKSGQHIAIVKKQQLLRLLHPCEYSYYDTLRIKLGWGYKPMG